MKGLLTLISVVICFSCLIGPVSSQSDIGGSSGENKNLSWDVPPAGTAIPGTKESMYEYQYWLEDCAYRLTKISNLIFKTAGMKENVWPEKPPGSGQVTTVPTIHVPDAKGRSRDPLGESTKLMTLATINGGSGKKSVNVTVPYSSWEMWYSVDPVVTGGQDSHSATGTNSAVFPSLSVVISNTATGKVIETVEPPGGLDIYLWRRAGDPRPWSEKFYEGNKEYTFDITAKRVKSYIIEVRVPR